MPCWRRQRVQRKTRVAELAARHPLRLFAFDLLYAGRRNCLGLPQRERSARLRKLLVSRANDAIVVTDTLMTHDVEELERYFDEMIHLGLEGVLAKRPDAPYQPGARSYDWVKLKRAYQSKLRDTVDWCSSATSAVAAGGLRSGSGRSSPRPRPHRRALSDGCQDRIWPVGQRLA